MAEQNREDDQGNDVPRVPVLAIQDLEHYIRSRAIVGRGESDRQDREILAREAEQQIADAKNYQEEVHTRIFGESKLGDYDDCTATRGAPFNEIFESVVRIRTGDGCERTLPLEPLVRQCDFFNRALSYSSSLDQGFAEDDARKPPSSPSKVGLKRQKFPLLEVSLDQFDAAVVWEFLSFITSPEERAVGDIKPGIVVECCRLAHYLQCQKIFDEISNILVESVDSENCLSMCQLADQLGIPSLYETAVNHMLTVLDELEKHEMWEVNETEGGMPNSLKVRILTMRNAVRSSLLGRGSATGVFFSSAEEFLAILSDNIREQKERLAEAKRRQREVINERLQDTSTRGDRPANDDRSGNLFALGCRLWRSIRDAQDKIGRQEQRIETLETFYREQKSIFQGAGWLKDRGSSFVL